MLDSWNTSQKNVSVELLVLENEHLYGARFSADIYTRGCYWYLRLLA
jgi:hypothetical protein